MVVKTFSLHCLHFLTVFIYHLLTLFKKELLDVFVITHELKQQREKVLHQRTQFRVIMTLDLLRGGGGLFRQQFGFDNWGSVSKLLDSNIVLKRRNDHLKK